MRLKCAHARTTRMRTMRPLLCVLTCSIQDSIHGHGGIEHHHGRDEKPPPDPTQQRRPTQPSYQSPFPPMRLLKMLLSQFPERVRARASAFASPSDASSFFTTHRNSRRCRRCCGGGGIGGGKRRLSYNAITDVCAHWFLCGMAVFCWRWWQQWLALLWKQHCLRTAQLPTRESRAETRARGCRRRRVGG